MTLSEKIEKCYQTNPELFEPEKKLKFIKCYYLKYFQKYFPFEEVDNVDNVCRAWRRIRQKHEAISKNT